MFALSANLFLRNVRIFPISAALVYFPVTNAIGGGIDCIIIGDLQSAGVKCRPINTLGQRKEGVESESKFVTIKKIHKRRISGIQSGPIGSNSRRPEVV
jgi:hypothetical protein